MARTFVRTCACSLVMPLVLSAFRPAPTTGPNPTRAAVSRSPSTVTLHHDLRAEVDSLFAAMVVAFKRDPSSVARFYTDDASIMGGGGRWIGRDQVDRYWGQGIRATDWILEATEVGGDARTPWVRGRSTLVGSAGRMVTDFVGILKRGSDGQLRFYVDMFVGVPSR
jgi:hypothetical protein